MTIYSIDYYNLYLTKNYLTSSSFESIINKINLIFSNVDANINDYFKNKNIITRTKKVSYGDAFLFSLLNSLKNSTKENVTSNLNYLNGTDVHRTSFQKKANKIPLSIYNDIYESLLKILSELKDKNIGKELLSIDGTYNNTNLNGPGQLETSLNMGIYNSTNKIPIELKFSGAKNKNNEIQELKKLISSSSIDFKNIIIICDRAYFSYKFFDFLNKNNISYVIRVKNNNKIKQNDYNYRLVNHTGNNIFEHNMYNQTIKLNEKIECNLVTNLDVKDYDDNTIKDIYMKRWDVEIFFKLIKHNFNFSCLRLSDKIKKVEDYEKKNKIIMIVLLLTSIIEKLDIKTRIKNVKNSKYTYKINKTLLITNIDKILIYLMRGTFTTDKFMSFCKSFIKFNNIKPNRKNERIAIQPFSKWYIKQYSNHNSITLIIIAKLNETVEKLNKNLKLIANKITILNENKEEIKKVINANIEKIKSKQNIKKQFLENI